MTILIHAFSTSDGESDSDTIFSSVVVGKLFVTVTVNSRRITRSQLMSCSGSQHMWYLTKMHKVYDTR